MLASLGAGYDTNHDMPSQVDSRLRGNDDGVLGGSCVTSVTLRLAGQEAVGGGVFAFEEVFVKFVAQFEENAFAGVVG
jgi:hypothetical protein